MITSQLNSHPAVALLAEMVGKNIFSSEVDHGATEKDPYAIRDGLLTFVCHKFGLPCDTSQNCVR